MSLFVLGSSRTGKTPFAAQVALALGWQHLSASEWVRRRFPTAPYPDRAAYVQAITRFALAELKRDPRACVDYLSRTYDLSRPFVIDGVRNPHDFIHLFDPRADAAVFLEHIDTDLPPTRFERGLEVIRAYLDYLGDTGLLEGERVFGYRFRAFHEPAGLIGESAQATAGPWPRTISSLDAAILDLLREWKRIGPPAAAEAGPAAPIPQRVHADIPPLKTHVRGEYLYDMDLSHVGEHVPCTAFAVSSYEGSVPTVKLLLADGSVFSYVPPSALIDPAKFGSGPELELADLAYHNCPGGDLCVHPFEELAGPVQAYFKRRDLWLDGEYLFTVDWYTGNDLLHLVALANGQYAFLPHHKLKFKDGPRAFQPYRKLHTEWKV
ncbi:MAG: hypothetical protein L0Z62_23295 [Gemmataceae bacterium]|nr:hypothetical protein [Gemmataceae bacterium]